MSETHKPPPSPRTHPQPSSSSVDAALPPTIIKGIAGSPGVAVGPALVVGDVHNAYVRRHVHSAQIPGELIRIKDAVAKAQDSLREVGSRLSGAHDQKQILEAYLMMLADPLLHEQIEKRIREEKRCAEWAVAGAAEEIAGRFPAASRDTDAYIRERRHDVEFVADRLLRALTGAPDRLIPKLDHPAIVIARDLSPADTAGMVREPALGFVTEVGTRTSHTSIMARALEIPAVVGADGALGNVRTGDTVIVDGLRGEVTIHPTEEQIADAMARAARHLAFAKGLLEKRDLPCMTACGTRISLKANVELPAEATLALAHGAEGIGLYRTEFLYIDRATPPSEDEQYEVYRAIVQTVAPRPVVLRTFDIGGDKFASSFQLPAEMNPALGLRAVRLALSRPDVFLAQLRAMVRASAHGDVRIMVPMIASVDEMRQVRVLLAEAVRSVDASGHERATDIALGMMIEVPSAAVMADVFVREAQFFSIGTNDLVQYALAVDRTSRSLAYLASAMHPSILRLLHSVTKAAARGNIPVAVCGTVASDVLAAPLLVGLGLRELSMEAAAIPEVKAALSRVTMAQCEALAVRALEAETVDAVEAVLEEELGSILHDLRSGTGD
ncbi:MAG TPA: phosphoenolpyruvate--protein phosphotransferase [Polyangiaceae bacterium]|nr:phosphoenolpyruvate--protein phosphotransferase [Polyangiaceae bacterium]